MKKLAIIPARGGSKRIPRKNIRPFLGKPIIAYSIEATIQSGLFDEVMVSTDDNEIATIARQYGAHVPFMRSNEKSGDYAGLTEVLLEVVDRYHENGEDYDYFCCVLPTAPLLERTDLEGAYRYLLRHDFDSVYPVVSFSYPILRSLVLSDAGEIRMRWPEYSNARSQDLEAAYHDAGTFYWIKTKVFREKRTFDVLKCGGIVVDESRVQDIDNETDWRLAELKYNLIHGEE